jgi:predicted phage terminase large subunit-like protein
MNSATSAIDELDRVRVEMSRRRHANDCRTSLAEFVRGGWPTVEPGTNLTWGWHIDAVCHHLEALTRGHIKRLLINMPPGHMKSKLVGVFWPAWTWLHIPSFRLLMGSYELGLSTRDNVACRMLVESDWYRDTFRPDWEFRKDQNVKTWFETSAGALRMALSVGGKGTGYRGDCTGFDDPHNVKRRPTDEELEESGFWWDKRMSSRLNDMRTGIRLGVMQRIHESDLSAKILERGEYTHLCLPTEYDPKDHCHTEWRDSDGELVTWDDPRTEAGELLFPEMFPPEVVDEIKIDLGDYGFAGQHNQRPTPASGGMIKRHQLRYWYKGDESVPPPVPVELEDGSMFDCPQMVLPDAFDEQITSSDLTFKGLRNKPKSKPDFVVSQAWARLDARKFMIDQIRDRWSFTETLAHMVKFFEHHSEVRRHVIEDKANGPAIMDTLEGKISGIDPFNDPSGKEARCEAVAPQINAGEVYLPHPTLYPWVAGLVDELCSFPFGKNDDQLDALVQALLSMDRQSGHADFV